MTRARLAIFFQEQVIFQRELLGRGTEIPRRLLRGGAPDGRTERGLRGGGELGRRNRFQGKHRLRRRGGRDRRGRGRRRGRRRVGCRRCGRDVCRQRCGRRGVGGSIPRRFRRRGQ